MKENRLKTDRNNYRFFHMKPDPRNKTGKLLLFSHGYGVNPKHYNFLEIMAHKGIEVVAPMMGAMNYLDNQPVTVKGCIDETNLFLQHFLAGQPQYKEVHFAGHSLGAETSIGLADKFKPTTVTAISPPIKRDLMKVAKGVVQTSIQDASTHHLHPKKIVSILSNSVLQFSASVIDSYKLAKDVVKGKRLINYKYPSLTKILYCGEDRLFPQIGDLVKLNMRESNVNLAIYKDENHSLPLAKPQFIADYIHNFMEFGK